MSCEYRDVAELSSRTQQSSPTHQRPKLIMQPAHPTPLDATTMTQLQRDNVDLKRQIHEHGDVVLALRRDLAAANARLSDVTGMLFYNRQVNGVKLADNYTVFTFVCLCIPA